MSRPPSSTRATAALLALALQAVPATSLAAPPDAAGGPAGEVVQSPDRTESPAAADRTESPAAVFRRLAESGELVRSVMLRDLGFGQPIVFSGTDAERQVFFGLPREVPIRGAEIDIVGSHLKGPEGRLNLVADIAGRPAAAFAFEGNEGDFRRTVPVPAPDAPDGFLRMGLRFAAVTSGDRCTDQRFIGNSVTIDPRTMLRYRIDPRDVANVRSAWSLLPYEAVVAVPDATLTRAQFDAALRVGLALHASGRKPVFVRMPAIGETVATGDIAVPEALGDVAAFRPFIDVPGEVEIRSAAERGAWHVLRAVAGRPPADIAVGGPDLRRAVASDVEALRAEIGRGDAGLLADFDRWVEGSMREPGKPGEASLSSSLVLGHPVIELDTESAPVSAALIGSRWLRLARSASLGVSLAEEGERSADYLPLSRLSGGFPAQAITDYGEWAISFTAAQLPPDRWPDAVELEMRVAPDSGDAAPVVSVLLNDTLLRAQKADDPSSVMRLSADIPRFLLGANNTLKIALQRGALAGDCKAVPRGYLAQVLPTSRLSLATASLDGQFFGLLPHFAKRGSTFVPPDYLDRPLESLPFVTAFLRSLSVTATSLRLSVAQPGGTIAPDSHFIAFGSGLEGARKGVRLSDDALVLAGGDGQPLVDLTGIGDVAVAQIAEIGKVQGVIVDTPAGRPLPEVRLDQLADGDVAVVDETGIIAEFGSAERRADALDRMLYEPAALFFRYREYIVAGLAVLAALITMRVVRTVVTRRKRRQAAADKPGHG